MRVICFLAMVCFVSGCVEVGPPAPYRPYSLIRAGKSADRIVVTMLPSVRQNPPKAVDYSLTLTGSEMQRLVGALAGVERSANSSSRILDDSTNPEWQLQYCSGTNVLATAAFSRTVLFCDYMDVGSPLVEFRSPRGLKRLYRRVTRESSVDH
jgi:hypothetical protein